MRIWLLALALSAGCGSADRDLLDEVGAAFAGCDPDEIHALARTYGVMPAFEPCGNNRISHPAWSPDGTVLAFQLDQTAHLLYADTPEKRVETVPTGPPAGPTAWLTATRLAVPLPPAAEGAPMRVGVYDIDGRTLFEHPLPGVTEVLAAERGRSAEELLLLVVGAEGRRIRALDTRSGAIAEPFPFVGQADTFTYTPAVDALVVGRDGADAPRTTLYVGRTGEVRGTFAPARRGEVHPDGRWLALEHDGPEVSIFYQRRWDTLPEAERQREVARAEELEALVRARGGPATKVRPPTLSFVDLTDGSRWALDSLYGRDFAWYEPTPHYASVLSWGFEQRELKRNVMLGDFGPRLRGIAAEAPPDDLAPMAGATVEGFVPGAWPSASP